MSLVAHYRFNGDPTDAINGLNGVETSMTYGAGKLGQGRIGSSGYITVTNDPKLQIIGALSISFWFNVSNLSARRTIIGKAYGGEYTINIEKDGHLRFYSGTAGANASPYVSRNSSNFIVPGVWYHAVFTRTQEGLRAWYIDGGLDVTDSTPNSTAVGSASPNNVRIGTGYTGSVVGSFDDVRFYDHVLSTKEIKELARAKVLHYTFDDFQEPTTNKLSDPSALFNYGIGTYTSQDSLLLDGGVQVDGTRTHTNDLVCRNELVTIPNGTTVTFSVEFFSESGNIVPRITGNRGVGVMTNVGGNRWELTWTNNDGVDRDETIYWKYTQGSDTAIDERWHFRNYQVEFKDHSTPFVLGSRTGLIRDSSGQGNDSNALTETYTPEWTEDSKIGSGAYKLDPTDYIISSWGSGYNPATHPLTLTAWVYPTLSGVNQIFLSTGQSPNVNARFYIGIYSNKWDMGIYTTAWNLGTQTVIYNEWHLISIVFDGSTATMKVDLQTTRALSYSSYTLNHDLYIGCHGSGLSYSYTGLIDDVRIYATALSADDIRDIYQVRASVDNRGNFSARHIIEAGYVDRNLCDMGEWTIGTGGSQGSFGRNGADAENDIIEFPDPWGQLRPVWRATPDATSGADGGWNKDFSCDDKKRYRISVWILRTGDASGSTYLGCRQSTANSENLDGTPNGNPYFMAGDYTYNQWLLWVGVIHPSTHGNDSWGIAGVYDLQGNKLHNGTEYKMTPGCTIQRHRSYLYYCTNTDNRQYWVYPRVDVMDGSEPSIEALCAGLDSRLYELHQEAKGKALAVRESAFIGQMNEVGPVRNIQNWWKLDGNFTDLMQNADLTKVGSPTWDGGIRGQGIRLDGTTDYVQGVVDIPVKRSWTISFWVYYEQHAGSQAFLMTTSYAARLLNNDVTLIQDDGTYKNIYGYISFVDGTWYQIMLVHDHDYDTNTGEGRIYVNGELRGTVALTDSVRAFSTLYLGYATGGGGPTYYYTKGVIDDARVYVDAAFGLREAKELYLFGAQDSAVKSTIRDNGRFMTRQFSEA